MQLDPHERSILAYFPTSEKAQEAGRAIVKAGLVKERGAIQIDNIHRYPTPAVDDQYDNPMNQGTTLSGLTLYSSESGPDGPNPLLAASESASGYGNPHAGSAGGRAYLLTIVMNEDDVGEAVNIIKGRGGYV
jgi:hypothetical protein